MSNKAKYRQLCSHEKSIPIFSKDWWLDAVAGEDSWDVNIVEKNNEIIGSFPYVKKRIYFLDIISNPMLTQTLGVWLKYPEGQKYATRLGFEKEIVSQLIKNLPKFDLFHQHFNYQFTNWLPFYWHGFAQTTRYTYLIEDLSDPDIIYKNFKDNIRREIRKAQKRLAVSYENDINEFYRLNKLIFENQGTRIPYDIELIKRIDDVCSQKKCRKIFFAKDPQDRVHAALYLIWDDNSAYYLMGGSDPALRNSGANSLLMWEAIQFAATVTQKFDFEGSMIEPIERFFRSFGAKQVPYFYISKRSLLIKILFFLRKKLEDLQI
jgi:Acetyltransferase (GNAT) domain